MLPRSRFYGLIPLFGTALLVGSAAAGEFTEGFAGRLRRAESASDTAPIQGIVMLAEQLDVGRLETEMAERGIVTRWRRHQHVLGAARDLALRTQPAVLARIRAERVAGAIIEAKPYWITNAIGVTADPASWRRLVAIPGVGTIHEDQPIDLRLGTEEPPAREPGRPLPSGTSGTQALQDGQVCVNVSPAWAEGLTGLGRLVALFDAGCDGNHPAYASRWRGVQPGVHWDWAWRDPYTNSQFPYDPGLHGTHVLGIMVADPPDADPLGIAYEAQWIAAGVMIGYNISHIIGCYQWAADPDSNLATIDDVPDVINNSWGTGANCDQTFWNAIDVVEAAGIVNVISVDNTGPAPASVNSPESRAETPYRNFSVGNVNPHIAGYPIYASSGRGPSPCDMTSIKPEVTAPGTSIYSTFPNGNYGTLTGTSMASPHVSGAVAVLRQFNPSLTVDQIKEALLVTAYDRGVAGEDNDYGMGIIDVGAAVAWVQANYPVAPPPRNLVAAVADTNDVMLSWSVPLNIPAWNPLVGYRVYRADGADEYPPDPIAELSFALPLGFWDMNRPDGDYRYVVTAVYQDGRESEPSNEQGVQIQTPVGVEAAGPAGALALRADPNPMSVATALHLEGLHAGPFRVDLLSAAGRRVRTFEERQLPAARGVRWDGRDDAGRIVPAGTYFALLTQGARRTSARITVIR